jgi:hypothetical protein
MFVKSIFFRSGTATPSLRVAITGLGMRLLSDSSAGSVLLVYFGVVGYSNLYHNS